MQAGRAEDVARAEASPVKHPVASVDNAVGRRHHRARAGLHHAEQRGRWLKRAMHAVLVGRFLVLRVEHQGRLVQE